MLTAGFRGLVHGAGHTADEPLTSVPDDTRPTPRTLPRWDAVRVRPVELMGHCSKWTYWKKNAERIFGHTLMKKTNPTPMLPRRVRKLTDDEVVRLVEALPGREQRSTSWQQPSRSTVRPCPCTCTGQVPSSAAKACPTSRLRTPYGSMSRAGHQGSTKSFWWGDLGGLRHAGGRG